MSDKSAAVIIEQRAVALGHGAWLHVLAEQRPGGSAVIVLRMMTGMPALTVPADARARPVATMPTSAQGPALEFPPHAVLELARALVAIGAKLGIRA